MEEVRAGQGVVRGGYSEVAVVCVCGGGGIWRQRDTSGAAAVQCERVRWGWAGRTQDLAGPGDRESGKALLMRGKEGGHQSSKALKDPNESSAFPRYGCRG